MKTNEDPLDQFLSGVTAKPKPTSDSLDDFLGAISTKPMPSKPAVQAQERFIMCYWPNGCVRPSPRFLAEQKILKHLSEETCCSFEEWKDVGYWVKKGAKSMFKDALGVPQFTIEQVTPPRY